MDSQITYFLGANAPSGFYSLYDELLPTEQARRIFLLKGGAGCGKSTLMRQVAADLAEIGESVEYIRCSGDPDSLDAVLFPNLRVAIFDATSPHVREPKLPGVVESYVDLGRFYRHDALVPLREEIKNATEGYQSHYKGAYRRLTAVAQLAEDNRSLLLSPAVEAKLQKRARGILSREIKKGTPNVGTLRRRFLGAVTCQGRLCFFDTVKALCHKVYEFQDTYGLASGMFTTLAAGALASGHTVILCPSPLFPDRAEHLLLPDIGLAFVTSTPELPYPDRPYRRVRIDAMIEQEKLAELRTRLKFSRKIQSSLLGEAVEALNKAKAEHDHLEALYHPYVDFAGVRAQAASITAELFNLKNEHS